MQDIAKDFLNITVSLHACDLPELLAAVLHHKLQPAKGHRPEVVGCPHRGHHQVSFEDTYDGCSWTPASARDMQLDNGLPVTIFCLFSSTAECAQSTETIRTEKLCWHMAAGPNFQTAIRPLQMFNA